MRDCSTFALESNLSVNSQYLAELVFKSTRFFDNQIKSSRDFRSLPGYIPFVVAMTERRRREKRMDMSSSSAVARRTWELENNIVNMEPAAADTELDSIYAYDEAAQVTVLKEKPWSKDPNYFKRVKVSALALLKMVVHARSGGTIEVMGLMQGKIDGDAFIVMDAFALPVEGTETRVNAQADANEYMVEYCQAYKQVCNQS